MLRSTFLGAVVGALAVLSLASSAIAAPLEIDAGNSTVTAVFRQLGAPVEARFKKFAAHLDFDNSNPDAVQASVDIHIDLASIDLGDEEYNREVLKEEWFHAARFPQARFVSSAIKASANAPAGTKYDVVGMLTIKGKTVEVRFPLTVKKEGSKQVFDGVIPIRRLAFNIGEGEWIDTVIVADEVIIKFHVVAAP